MSLPPCPKCHSEYTYEDGAQYVCPECAHEWNEADAAATGDDALKSKMPTARSCKMVIRLF